MDLLGEVRRRGDVGNRRYPFLRRCLKIQRMGLRDLRTTSRESSSWPLYSSSSPSSSPHSWVCRSVSETVYSSYRRMPSDLHRASQLLWIDIFSLRPLQYRHLRLRYQIWGRVRCTHEVGTISIYFPPLVLLPKYASWDRSLVSLGQSPAAILRRCCLFTLRSRPRRLCFRRVSDVSRRVIHHIIHSLDARVNPPRRARAHYTALYIPIDKQL